jgi:hypothetical protein
MREAGREFSAFVLGCRFSLQQTNRCGYVTRFPVKQKSTQTAQAAAHRIFMIDAAQDKCNLHARPSDSGEKPSRRKTT